MSHERSITIGTDKGYVNIPSVHKGKQLSTKEAVGRYKSGKQKPLGGKTYKSQKEAVSAAKARSKKVGKSHLQKNKKK